MDEYSFIVDMYKTKATTALQFIDNIVVWTILPLLVGLIFSFDKLESIRITSFILPVIFFVIITPILLIIFSYLKYREYNYRWHECIIKSLVATYIKKHAGVKIDFITLVNYIHTITGFSKDEIVVILYHLQSK